jgi:hypothetical protein
VIRPPFTSIKTAWTKVRDKAKVVGRWHDNRHTLVTELSASGAVDHVIMSIAGHLSRAMLSRYSRGRMETKRRALDEIAARQCAADRERKDDPRREQAAVVSQPAAVELSRAVPEKSTLADGGSGDPCSGLVSLSGAHGPTIRRR